MNWSQDDVCGSTGVKRIMTGKCSFYVILDGLYRKGPFPSGTFCSRENKCRSVVRLVTQCDFDIINQALFIVPRFLKRMYGIEKCLKKA